MNFDQIVQHHRVLYMDLEWLCWDGPPPPGMKQEIIEIGVVELSLETLEITQEASYFIRPKRWEVSPRCTRLTGVTREDILAGRPFAEVMADITRRFRPAATPSCAWGDDHSILTRACDPMRVPNPFRQPIDLSKVFQGVFATRETKGLEDAVTMMGLTFDGFSHGALPDARNTARVHAEMMRRMRLTPPEQDVAIDATLESVPVSPFAEKLAQAFKNLRTQPASSQTSGREP